MPITRTRKRLRRTDPPGHAQVADLIGVGPDPLDPFAADAPRRASEGDGAMTPPRLVLEEPTLDRERPSLNARAQKRDRILSLVSAATAGLGALADAPGLAVTGASLADGFAENRMRRQRAFMDALTEFRERRREVQDEQRQTSNREALTNYEAALEGYRDRREHQQRLNREEKETEEFKDRRRFEDKRDKVMRKWERGLPLTEEEKRELAQEDRRLDIMARRETRLSDDEGGQESEFAFTEEGIDDEIRSLQQYLENGVQETNSFGETYRRPLRPDEQMEVRDRLRRLRRRRKQLIRGRSDDRTNNTSNGKPGRPPGNGPASSGASSFGDQQREARSQLRQAIQTQDSTAVMKWARQARKMRAISPEQFRKLQYNFGQ
jgi:hypothetical protein